MSAYVSDFILERVPEFAGVISRLGLDYIQESSYAAVSALYTFAVEAYRKADEAVLFKILNTVEDALSSHDEELVDPFSIDFIEALASEKKLDHYCSFAESLGAESRKDLAAK